MIDVALGAHHHGAAIKLGVVDNAISGPDRQIADRTSYPELSGMCRGMIATIFAIGVLMVTSSRAADEPVPRRARIRAVDVATLPHPGTVVPGAISFARDGKVVTYLKSESNSLARALWSVELGADPLARVIARAPDGGDTDATVSKEEQLRRERQRLRETGITQVVRASGSDLIVVPIGGDLFLYRPGGELKRFTETPSPEIDPKPSADGSAVAFVRDGELFTKDVESGREIQLSKGAADGISNGLAEFIAQEEFGRFTGYWWSPDGSKIAYQQTDERNIPLYTIAHQDGPNYSAETHRYPFAGAENALVRLGVVPASGGATTWLNLAEPAEDFYLARVDWDGPGDLLVQILSRDQKTLRLLRVNVGTGERTLVVEDRAETYVNLHNDLRIIPGTGEILWSSERTGFRHLELRDRDGKLVRTITSGDWPVDAVVGLDAKRREVWFTAGKDGALEANLYRVSLEGGTIVRATPESGTHRIVVAEDANHFVDTFSDLKTPPVTTIRDRDGKILATLDDAAADPRVETMDLVAPQLTEFKNRDGVLLHGAYYPPRSCVPGTKSPLIVMVYGGPHVQNVTSSWAMTADLTAQFLAEQGFAVWKLDNRGSARRGLAFESALYRRMGEVEVRDQMEGVKFIAGSHPEVDSARVGITGGSYGGYMTLRCLQLAPDVFRAGVAIAPVTDWDGYDTGYTERYMGTPKNNPEGYKSSSVLEKVNSLSGRLLVIHGMLDENVHFRHSARLATALIAADKPFEMLPVPSERHSSRKVPERTYITERLSNFFSKAFPR
ncbi:MAG: dipeptidyl aminopeptidase/acylaminoacyl peptidase [Planctomycetota bacterium]|nr:dipeptidyl aminopeptidase/acylaminoacyl peptidase [Planctomycetota bacterium]